VNVNCFSQEKFNNLSNIWIDGRFGVVSSLPVESIFLTLQQIEKRRLLKNTMVEKITAE